MLTIARTADNVKNVLNVLARRKILFLLVVALSVITSSLAAYQGWIDSGFPYMNIADSEIVAREQHIIVNPFPPGASSSQNNVANVRSSRFEVVLVPVFLSKVLGISLPALVFLPITGILLPLVGYLVVRMLLSSEVWGFVFGAYLALEPQGLLRDYNANIQGYGQLFFLLTLFLASKFFLSKPDKKYFLLIVITFAMTVFSYYSSEFYSLVFTISLVILLYLKRVDRPRLHFLLNASIVFVIITASFEPIVGSYFQKLSEGGGRNILSVLGTFMNDVLRVMGLRAGQESTSSVISTPSYLLVLNVSLLLAIFLPLLVFLPRMLKGKQYQEAFVASIILTGILDFVAYSGLEGHVDLKFFYLFFPMCSLVALAYVGNIRGKLRFFRIAKVLFAVGILLIVSLRFGLYATGPYMSFSHLHPGQLTEFDTIVDQSGSSHVYLTDNLAAGKLLVSLAKNGLYESVTVYQYPSVEGISFLYSGNVSDFGYLIRSVDRVPAYLVVTQYSLRTYFPAQGWSSFPPLANFTQVLNATNVAVSYMGLDATLLSVRFAEP